MANHASALKAHRQNLRRRAVNRRNQSQLRTELKKIRQLAASGDAGSALKMLPATISLIDRSIRKKVLHGNAAARHKSRLTRLVRSAAAKS